MTPSRASISAMRRAIVQLGRSATGASRRGVTTRSAASLFTGAGPGATVPASFRCRRGQTHCAIDEPCPRARRRLPRCACWSSPPASAGVEAIRGGTSGQRFDAIVSTDGDADRPLIADADGTFVRGDLVGAITAWQLGADWIVTPVTSNSALESCGRFPNVLRTRVGSPYVIDGMRQAVASGGRCVVGFEANGGVLLGSTVEKDGRVLKALPTRDAMLPILCCLSVIAATGSPLASVAAGFGFKAGASNRLKEVPGALSAPFLARLAGDRTYTQALLQELGAIAGIDDRDGVRISTAAGEIVHFRASGNAPELRCYVEAPVQSRADALLAWGLRSRQGANNGKLRSDESDTGNYQRRRRLPALAAFRVNCTPSRSFRSRAAARSFARSMRALPDLRASVMWSP